MASGHYGPPRKLAARRGTMDNWNTIKAGRRGNWRNLTEPNGAPTGWHYALKSTFFFRLFCALDPPVFAFPAAQVPGGFETPGIGRMVGYRRNEKDYRNMGTADHRGTWRGPAEPDGTPRNINMKELIRGVHLFLGPFRSFAPLVSPFPPPFPNTRRFRGFETLGINSGAGYRNEKKGHRTQRTSAELGGAPRNHGQQAHKHSGPPRNLAQPDGTRGTPIEGNYALKSIFFHTLGTLGPRVFSFPLTLYPTFRWFRDAWYSARDRIWGR